MPQLGVSVAIVDDGRILLTKREDFEVWCLPGGAVDPGESVAQAAVREAREETGLQVELTRLVGVYSRPNDRFGGVHVVLFAARPVGGALQLQPEEVIEAAYFGPATFPEPFLWVHRQQALDALSGAHGVARAHNQPWPFDPKMSRQALYDMRDRSGLSRQQFYLQHSGQSGPEDVVLEVGDVPGWPEDATSSGKESRS